MKSVFGPVKFWLSNLIDEQMVAQYLDVHIARWQYNEIHDQVGRQVVSLISEQLWRNLYPSTSRRI